MNQVHDWVDYLTARRRVASLEERNRALAEEAAIHEQHAALATFHASGLAKLLDTARLEHGKALQRVDELEVALCEAHELLCGCAEMRRSERTAARTWLTRAVSGRVWVN
jgi:hypothetical protein